MDMYVHVLQMDSIEPYIDRFSFILFFWKKSITKWMDLTRKQINGNPSEQQEQKKLSGDRNKNILNTVGLMVHGCVMRRA